MKLVLDTNAYCLCDRGLEAALNCVERARTLYLPAVVYGELYYGFKYGARLQSNLRRLNTFIDKFAVTLISVDDEVARKYGDIFAVLRAKGRPIPTNDIWIAASCMSVGGTLLTADRHFQEIPHIQTQLLNSVSDV
ncbi:MAG TPA: VapC toxin family PIN domain ribonuclease [Deltaproteobacteria bacterium]|nr:VapC toxin family PIN domain ribonuclease [Deltaproteobacteria bacterium]